MFNAGMMGHMSQQQQMALLQQMAQLQMAQLGNIKAPTSAQPLSMVIPGAGQFVLVPQNQLHQMQQFQDAQIRQQIQQQQQEIEIDREMQKHQKSFQKPEILRIPTRPKNPQNPPKIVSKNVGNNGKPVGQKQQPRALPKRVLVTKLPPHIKTVETLADVFYPYGIISEIQIFKDRSQLTEGLSEIISKVDPRPNATPAATVEFETSQAAKFAVSIMRKREKQLQFRVALLKGDSVDEKHCHNYQKPGRRPSSTKAESGAETDNFSSSGYDTCSLKSESPRPHENTKPTSESSAEYYNDQCILADFEHLAVSNMEEMKRNLGPIARPQNINKKTKNSQKTGQLSRFRANYKGQQAM